MSQATEVTGGVGAKGQADWLEVLRAGGVGLLFTCPPSRWPSPQSAAKVTIRACYLPLGLSFFTTKWSFLYLLIYF